MEKENEFFLENVLKNFPREYIYYSSTHHVDLKKIFCKASKQTDTGRGEPDRIIYDEKTLLVVEVKPKSLKDAIRDLEIYCKKMCIAEFEHLDIYFIAFINDKEYKIFDKRFKETNILLKPENFGMNLRAGNDFSLTKDLKQVHQYIYDNMAISNDDRAFFIAIVLIGIKSEMFRNMIKNITTVDQFGIFNELRKIVEYHEISTSNFEFLRNDTNNKHLYWIICKCISMYERSTDNFDLMSRFYNEFLKYNNDSLKSVGCVLTPEHCSEIMTDLLEIKKDDIILDLCAGTGTLIFQCNKKNPKRIIVCEQQTKLVTLLHCQKILLNNDTIDIYNGDCFDRDYDATKSIINPPYGELKNELEFCSKQLESISDGGLAVSIIPVGKINSPSKYRDKIFETAKIRKIIIMNEKLFQPFAAPHTAILLLEKSEGGHDTHKDYVKIANFQEDGYKTKIKYGRIDVNFEAKKKELYSHLETIDGIFIEKDGFWLKDFLDYKLCSDPLYLYFQREREREQQEKEKYILELLSGTTFDTEERREFKMTELFDIVKKPTNTFNNQKVLCISAKNNNNGVNGYKLSDGKVFPAGNFVAVTGGNGGAGLVYYIDEPFIIESSTIVLKPKFNISHKEHGNYIACILSSKFKKMYSRSNGWSQTKMKNDSISLPIDNKGNINFASFQNQINLLR